MYHSKVNSNLTRRALIFTVVSLVTLFFSHVSNSTWFLNFWYSFAIRHNFSPSTKISALEKKMFSNER
jgi:hypothetical protein